MTNILGDGILEKLRLAVIYFIDSKRKPIGTGFFVSPRVAISAAHTFTESVKVGAMRTGYFGKPHVGKTCQLKVDLIDRENDFIIFAIQGKDAPQHLEPAPVRLDPGGECILVAYQLGIHDELKELGKEPSVGVFPGAITKAHERHFVYNAPSFAGDSGGAIILQEGQAIGMHIMTVNQALELQRFKSLDEDKATTSDIVQHIVTLNTRLEAAERATVEARREATEACLEATAAQTAAEMANNALAHTQTGSVVTAPDQFQRSPYNVEAPYNLNTKSGLLLYENAQEPLKVPFNGKALNIQAFLNSLLIDVQKYHLGY